MKERFDELVLSLNILRGFGGDHILLSDCVYDLKKRSEDLDIEINELQQQIGAAIQRAWLAKEAKAITPNLKGVINVEPD